MRHLVLIALGAMLAGSAYASFDLFIAPNATENYTRFDPINRVNLGSIFMSNPRYAAAVSSRRDGLFTYGAGLYRVNWSTGERLSIPTFNSSPINLSEDGNRFARMNGSSIIFGTYTAGGDLTTLSAATPSFTTVSVTHLSNNRWIAYGSQGGLLVAQIFDDSGAAINSISTLATNFGLLANSIGQATVVRRGAAMHFLVPYRDSGANHRMSSLAVSAGGGSFTTNSDQGLSGFSTANAATTLAAVRGHTGFFMVGADAATPTSARITEFDDAPNFVASMSYTTNAFSPIVTQRWQMTNIVAPEPGTMLGLAAGAGWLLRRRLRK